MCLADLAKAEFYDDVIAFLKFTALASFAPLNFGNRRLVIQKQTNRNRPNLGKWSANRPEGGFGRLPQPYLRGGY